MDSDPYDLVEMIADARDGGGSSVGGGGGRPPVYSPALVGDLRRQLSQRSRNSLDSNYMMGSVQGKTKAAIKEPCSANEASS